MCLTRDVFGKKERLDNMIIKLESNGYYVMSYDRIESDLFRHKKRYITTDGICIILAGFRGFYYYSVSFFVIDENMLFCNQNNKA